jgi:hypothetical protein
VNCSSFLVRLSFWVELVGACNSIILVGIVIGKVLLIRIKIPLLFSCSKYYFAYV